jgi:hypothetical protein
LQRGSRAEWSARWGAAMAWGRGCRICFARASTAPHQRARPCKAGSAQAVTCEGEAIQTVLLRWQRLLLRGPSRTQVLMPITHADTYTHRRACALRPPGTFGEETGGWRGWWLRRGLG